jgi:hypothetical protein
MIFRQLLSCLLMILLCRLPILPLRCHYYAMPLLRHYAYADAPDYFTPLSITPFFLLSRHATPPPLFSPPLSLAVTPLSLRFIYAIFIIYCRRRRFDAALISILRHCTPALMPSCHAIIRCRHAAIAHATLLYDIAMRQRLPILPPRHYCHYAADTLSRHAACRYAITLIIFVIADAFAASAICRHDG